MVIVVGNKVDEEDKRKVTEAEGRAFAARYGLPHVETSAATGEGGLGEGSRALSTLVGTWALPTPQSDLRASHS